MSQTYIKRSLEPILKKAAAEFPAVVLTGPRQSGKTTLLQHLFSKSHQYVSLEPPDVRASAIEDPRSFLELYPPPVIFDEVQYAPDLLPYIKEKIDADHHKPLFAPAAQKKYCTDCHGQHRLKNRKSKWK